MTMPNDNALRELTPSEIDLLGAKIIRVAPSVDGDLVFTVRLTDGSASWLHGDVAYRTPARDETRAEDANLPTLASCWGIAPNATVLPCCDAEEQLNALRAAVAPLVERAKALRHRKFLAEDQWQAWWGYCGAVVRDLAALELASSEASGDAQHRPDLGGGA